MPVVLSVLSAVLWGSADFAGGLLARRLRPQLVVALSQATALLVLCVVVALVGAWHLGSWLWWGAAAGLTGSVSLIAFYAALASGTMGVVSPIAAMGGVVPVAVSIIGGERPGLLASAGIALALIGAVAAGGPEFANRRQTRPIALAVFAGLGFGLVFVFLARGSQSSVLMTLWAQRVASVGLLSLVLAASRPIERPGRRDLGCIAAVGIADGCANLAFTVASTMGFVSVTSVLASLYPVTTVLLARTLLHERLLPVQLLGVMAALGGVALVSVR